MHTLYGCAMRWNFVPIGMRHATPDMTLKYGEAVTSTKRKANLKVVKMVLGGQKKPETKKAG